MVLDSINLVLQRHGNHASVSGYDRICNHMPARVISRVQNPSIVTKCFARTLKSLYVNSGATWYGRPGLITEGVVAAHWLQKSNQVFHFLYGENAFRYSGNLKSIRHNTLVCTYHTPPSVFNRVVHDRSHLPALDAIIVLTRAHIDFFADIIGKDRVWFIPHGVDVDFFRPAATAKSPSDDNFKCLFVGSHLRDFELLARTARVLARSQPEVSFDVITLKKDHHYFDGLSNVRVRSGLNDHELRASYQNSDLFLMPLKDATANNSLLEAMSCGMPIVVTDLPGVRDYVDESSAKFVQLGDAEGFASEILNLRQDPDLRTKLGLCARTQALSYSHQIVARRTMEVYEAIGKRS